MPISCLSFERLSKLHSLLCNCLETGFIELVSTYGIAEMLLGFTGKQYTDGTGVAKASGLIAPALAGSYNIQAHYMGETLYYAKDSSIKILTVT